MVHRSEDLAVEIDDEGVAHPLGVGAIARLQAHAGRYGVLPSPAGLVVLRRRTGGRRCLLLGEVVAPGALCDVATFLGQSGQRGELFVHDAEGVRSILLEQGHVVAASSTVGRERLGQVLERYGLLTRERVEACSEAASSALRFGEAAVKLGFLTHEQLFRAMARQVEEIFHGALLIAEGVYYFVDGFDERTLPSRQLLPVSGLVREGVRRMHEERYFRARIPSLQHVPARTTGRKAPEQDPHGVYAAVDGARSVEEMCRALGESELDVQRALLQLIGAGLVSVGPPRLDVTGTVGVYNQAVAMIMRELDAMDVGDDVRPQLARFARGAAYAAVLDGAGPADDGTLNAVRVAINLEAQPDPAASRAQLQRWLHELASYAMFLARPHLHRAYAARKEPPPPSQRVSRRVAAVLEPIAPSTSGLGPGSRSK